MGTDGHRRHLLSVGEEAEFYASRLNDGERALVLGGAPLGLLSVLAEKAELFVVDPTEEAQRALEGWRQRQPPELRGRVRSSTADLRALRLEERFSRVLAPHNVLGLLGRGQLDAVLATARHHLTKEGLFVFDVHNPHRPVARASEDEERVAPRAPPGELVFVPHLRGRRVASGKSSPIHRFTFRPVGLDELWGALVVAGLVALERYAGFSGEPFSSAATRAAVVAEAGG
jgi:hypothetical protein